MATGTRIPGACLATFSLVWLSLAIAPRYRADWFLENLLVFVAVPALVFTGRRFRFSDRAYVQMTAFLLLHTIGSHYTYSEVPAGEWFRDLLGLSRNHYDRAVHLAFGILAIRPIRELAFRSGREPGRLTALALTVAAAAAFSVTYEIVEWLTAIVVDPAAGTAFLGTQGDEWDAQKDMSLALLGALLGATLELRHPLRRTAGRHAGGTAAAKTG